MALLPPIWVRVGAHDITDSLSSKKLLVYSQSVFAGCLNDCSDGSLALKKLGAVTGSLHVIQMDVTSQEQVDAARDYVQRNLPSSVGLWGLVNNAGLGFSEFIEFFPMENFQKVEILIKSIYYFGI